jgi:hypothetical protein
MGVQQWRSNWQELALSAHSGVKISLAEGPWELHVINVCCISKSCVAALPAADQLISWLNSRQHYCCKARLTTKRSVVDV